MGNVINSLAIYVLAGMKVKIKASVDYLLAQGWFPRKGTVKLGDQTKTLQNGFCVEDDAVGEIVEVKTNELAVVYHHKKAEKNSIWFFAITGEIAVCNITAVPIHDHSSIVQGGPSFGTYMSDDQLAM